MVRGGGKGQSVIQAGARAAIMLQSSAGPTRQARQLR